MKSPAVILVGVIPVLYGVIGYAVASLTEVFAPESRPKFALLYAMLALVSGVTDYFRMHYAQESSVWLPPRLFVRGVIRGHLLTLILVLAGAGVSFLLDIDTGWPVVLGFFAGPVTGRAFSLLFAFTTHLAYQTALVVTEVALYIGVLIVFFIVVYGR